MFIEKTADFTAEPNKFYCVDITDDVTITMPTEPDPEDPEDPNTATKVNSFIGFKIIDEAALKKADFMFPSNNSLDAVNNSVRLLADAIISETLR